MVEEFNDYIARPKSNGYQSLHTVVRDAQQKAIEIKSEPKTCTTMQNMA
jgi:GTP pyrophosphokinase